MCGVIMKRIFLFLGKNAIPTIIITIVTIAVFATSVYGIVKAVNLNSQIDDIPEVGSVTPSPSPEPSPTPTASLTVITEQSSLDDEDEDEENDDQKTKRKIKQREKDDDIEDVDEDDDRGSDDENDK